MKFKVLFIIILIVILISLIILLYKTSKLNDLLPLINLFESNPIRGGNESKFKFGDTWDDLRNEPHKYYDLIRIQESVVDNKIDWSPVFESLKEEVLIRDVEYAGLINIENNVARVICKHRGKKGSKSSIYIAHISHNLANKIKRMPAPIFFHTHPINGSSIPSAND